MSFGKELADHYHLPQAPDDKMRAKLQDILITRGNFEAFQMEILTREELRNVLLAHMVTLIASTAGIPEPNYHENPDLDQKVDAALFGQSR